MLDGGRQGIVRADHDGTYWTSHLDANSTGEEVRTSVILPRTLGARILCFPGQCVLSREVATRCNVPVNTFDGQDNRRRSFRGGQ